MLGTDLFKDKPKAQDRATNPESVRRMNVTVTTNEPRTTCTYSNFLKIVSFSTIKILRTTVASSHSAPGCSRCSPTLMPSS